jgi:putative transposase
MTKKTLLENKDEQAISKAIDLLVEHGVDLATTLQEGGILKQLTKRLVEKALNAEMENPFGLHQISTQ